MCVGALIGFVSPQYDTKLKNCVLFFNFCLSSFSCQTTHLLKPGEYHKENSR
jgi:hypothetical protein